MSGNSGRPARHSSGTQVVVTTATGDLGAYDRLPATLRALLRDLAVDYSAERVAQDRRQGWPDIDIAIRLEARYRAGGVQGARIPLPA